MSNIGPSARVVARRVLKRVESGSYATLALSAEMQRSRLGEKERRLATELTYGVLRNRSRLDRALSSYARKGLKKLPPGVLLALRVAAYQILFLERIPAHAVVDDAVTEVRRVAGTKLGGFANGLLRTLVREGEPELPPGDDLDSVMARSSLPRWLAELLLDRVGADGLGRAAEAMLEVAPLSLRVNRKRTTLEALVERLQDGEGAHCEASSLYPWAVDVSSLGSPEHSQSFSDGLWTVQDQAAQLIGAMSQAEAGGNVLDACAGVGGKTTHLAELGLGLHIDAVDLSKKKIALLEESVKRLGCEGITTHVSDSSRDDAKLASDYDLILLDAPCSGLGVLRRHPEAKWGPDKSPQIAELVALQVRLLDAMAKRVRPGGVLLYSVCTFTSAEGPTQIRDFLERQPSFEMAPPVSGGASDVEWGGLLSTDGSFESWPHANSQDAFYAARMRRR
ncbi:MAG: 16S rRNA (cytosine(967)-C(5))-methyltransferase RsmB [Myxococcales bacterium]|nr:16S rRNA (cytosine(967)-C(5))-methyltransferase RsmB [Myxococcales bacterium]